MTASLIITVLSAFMASSGIWSVILYVITKRTERKAAAAQHDTVERKMILALAHDRIYYLCETIISEYRSGHRVWLDSDEYDNLRILYENYRQMGGNGTCKRLFEEVSSIPINC